MLRVFVAALLAFAQLWIPGETGAEESQAVKKSQPSENQRVRALLDESVNMAAFQQKMSLKEFLGILAQQLEDKKSELPILVNSTAFRNENDAAPDVFDTEVQFPLYPRKMSAGSALRIALSKIATNNATYCVRQGYVEITTVSSVNVYQLLKQPITIRFQNRTLESVMEDLADTTGATFVLDKYGRREATTKITLTFNQSNLRGVIRVLAEEAGLKMVIIDDVIVLTTPEHAKTLQLENKDFRHQDERYLQQFMPPGAPLPDKGVRSERQHTQS